MVDSLLPFVTPPIAQMNHAHHRMMTSTKTRMKMNTRMKMKIMMRTKIMTKTKMNTRTTENV